jgi:hypothetical protein
LWVKSMLGWTNKDSIWESITRLGFWALWNWP